MKSNKYDIIIGHISNFEELGTDRRIAGGISDEIANRIVREGYGIRNAHGVDYEVERLKLILDDMMEKASVDILYHTFFCDSIVKNSEIVGVIVQNKSGRQEYMAKVIIDCTGDGDVGAKAGCDIEIGRDDDNICQPVTMMFTIGGVDIDKVNAFKKEYEKKYSKDKNPWNLSRIYKEAVENGDMEPFQTCNMGWWWTATRPDQVGVNFTHVTHIDTTKAEDLTRATIIGRKQCYQTIDVYRKYIPGMENCYMISTPNTIGLRESRRIMGDYVVTEEDLMNQTYFEDAIGFGSFYIDIHNLDSPGMSETTCYPPTGFKYQMPYRMLVPKKIDNLLVAGRCVSCTHIALGSLRVMVPCMSMGQAAGTAAAMSIDENITPRNISIKLLQAELRKNGGILHDEDIVPAGEFNNNNNLKREKND